jgi:hypothetical protein
MIFDLSTNSVSIKVHWVDKNRNYGDITITKQSNGRCKLLGGTREKAWDGWEVTVPAEEEASIAEIKERLPGANVQVGAERAVRPAGDATYNRIYDANSVVNRSCNRIYDANSVVNRSCNMGIFLIIALIFGVFLLGILYILMMISLACVETILDEIIELFGSKI